MKKQFKAETFSSLLIGILLFSMLFIIYGKWQNQSAKQKIFLYQQRQAMQIAENQLSLIMAHLPCETSIKQNRLIFSVDCTKNKIIVKFPAGEFRLAR